MTPLHGQSEQPRNVAEENFKAAFGHYPQRVELPEPRPDPSVDALIARWSRRGDPPTLRAIEGGRDDA
jgi:hypothetical protein